MSSSRIVGFVLIAAGVILVVMGVSASRSLADSLRTTFTGRLTKGTLWYYIGGDAPALDCYPIGWNCRPLSGRKPQSVNS